MGDALHGADVLVVDDDGSTRELLRSLLEARGARCALAADATTARRLLLERDFALALCDISMPGESGLHLARHVVAEHHDTGVLMVTAEDDPDVAEAALAFGAYGYIIKPFRPRELVIAVSAALRRREAELTKRNDRDSLRYEAVDLRSAVERLHQTSAARASELDTIERLTRAISERSHETGDHIARVGTHAGRLARKVGLPPERCDLIERAARLHDIGKIAVPDHVLLKPARLTPEEREEMKRHTQVGHYVLTGSDSELLRLAAEIALSHHERYDGHGYPLGRAGEEIPYEGRIAAIADVFDALTNDRVYRRAFSPERALELMRAERGGQFDPVLLDAFIELVAEDREAARVGDSRISA